MEFKDPSQAVDKKMEEVKKAREMKFAEFDNEKEVNDKQKAESSEQDEKTTKSELTQEEIDVLLKEAAKSEKKQKMEEVELSDSHPVAETLSLEKDPGNPGQYLEKESSGEKLEALSEELEKAREEYIKKDCDMDKKANKFLKAFGLGRAGLGEYEKEIEEYKSNYENALKNYKDAVIDSEHVEDKEDIEIATRGFVIGENLNRESIRADLEAQETGWSKTLIKGFNGLTEKYRKLSFKQKLLIGAGVAGVGIASSAIGGAAAIGGAGFIGGYRAFTMGISSVGFSSMLETIAQRGKDKRTEKEVEKIKDSRFEGLESGMEASYEKLKEALDKNIEDVNSKIQKEKQWKVWRKYMGAGAGIGLSIAGRYLGKEIAEHFGGETPEIKGGTGEIGADKDLQKILEDMEPQVRENFEEMKEIITKKGLEGNYTDEQIAQMARHPSADKFFEMLEKGTTSEQMEQTYEKAVESLEKASPEEMEKIEELKKWMKLSPEERIKTSLGGEIGAGEDFKQFKDWAEKNNMPFSEEELKKIYQWNGEGEISIGEDNSIKGGAIADGMGEGGRETMRQEVEKVLGGHKLNVEAPEDLNMPEINSIEIAKSGDSVWKLAENQLESRGYFKSLTGTPEEILAKKTYLIDAIKDKIAETPKDFGMTDANKLQIGQKVDFSGIFENKNDIGNIIDKAEALGKDKIESITQNLTGESLSHGAVAETVFKQTEVPIAEAAKMEAPVETMSEIEMQNRQLAEMKIAHALGLNPREYSAINDTSVGKLLSEMDKFQELGAKKYIPDLPHHGIYGNPERYDHARLAEFIKGQLNNVPEGDRLSVKEFLMKVNLESLPSDSAVISKHFSFEDGAKYLAGVLQQETAETIKTCAGNIDDWNNIKNVPVVDSGQNEIVENIRTAVSKVLPESTVAPSRNDTVENWMIKITKEAYKRGLADDLREQLYKLKVKG